MIINNKIINIPNHINILGYRYSLKGGTNEEIQKLLDVRNETTYAGAVSGIKHAILINNEEPMADELILDTIIHETIHAIEFKMDLDLEEDTVRKLGVGLATVFKGMLNWIEEEVEL